MGSDEEETMISEESDDVFAFETDHLALRRNKDYCELLKYIVKLESQKVKVLQDIEEIADAQREALEDPLEFVEKLKNGSLNFPPHQIIPNLPDIDWDKYGIDSNLDLELEEYKEKLEEVSNETKVRGRTFTENKPETFNQLWSLVEQKRLEELLEIYPEEQTESKRYKKIAEALGTRTPLQVMSRVQKYFAKLAKAGLPIPGRVTKKLAKTSRANILYKKSTFFPQLHVPVQMDDPNESSDVYDRDIIGTRSNNDSTLLLLKTAKEQRILDEKLPVWQTNTTCVGCMKTGFLGARWTDNAGTDYCTDCIVKLLPTEKLTPVRDVVS